MNKAELAAHVTAHADLPKGTADRAVSAVFAAIGDALAKDEAVTIAGEHDCGRQETGGFLRSIARTSRCAVARGD